MGVWPQSAWRGGSAFLPEQTLSWRCIGRSWDRVPAERDPGASCGQGTPALHLSLALNWVLGGVHLLCGVPRPHCSRVPGPARGLPAPPGPPAPTPWKAAWFLLKSGASTAVGQTDRQQQGLGKKRLYFRGGAGPEAHGEDGRPGWLALIGRITQFASRGVCRRSLALSKELLPLPTALGSTH